MQWLYRMQARWRVFRNSGDQLNRRVEVENILLSVYSGKRPMLTQDECRELAYKLGIPSAVRPARQPTAPPVTPRLVAQAEILERKRRSITFRPRNGFLIEK